MTFEREAAIMHRANVLRSAEIQRLAKVAFRMIGGGTRELRHWIEVARCPPGMRI